MLQARWKLIVSGLGCAFAIGASRVQAEPAAAQAKGPTAAAPAPKPTQTKRSTGASEGAQGKQAPAPGEAATNAGKKGKKRAKAAEPAKSVATGPVVAAPPTAAAPAQPVAASRAPLPPASPAPASPAAAKPSTTCSLLEAEQPRGGRLDVMGTGFGQAPLVRIAGKPVRMLERRDDRISVQVPAESDGGPVSVQSDGRSTDCGQLVIIGKNR